MCVSTCVALWGVQHNNTVQQEDDNNQNSEHMLVCQGTVVEVLKEENTYVTVEIKWDRECLRERETVKHHRIS